MDGTLSGKWKPHVCNKGLCVVFSFENTHQDLNSFQTLGIKMYTNFKGVYFADEHLKCRYMFSVPVAE